MQISVLFRAFIVSFYCLTTVKTGFSHSFHIFMIQGQGATDDRAHYSTLKKLFTSGEIQLETILYNSLYNESIFPENRNEE